MEKVFKSGGKIETTDCNGQLFHIQARFRNTCYKIGNKILDYRGNFHTIQDIKSTMGDEDVLFYCERQKLILLQEVVGKICPGEVVNVEKRINKWKEKYKNMAASKTVTKLNKLEEIQNKIKKEEAIRLPGLLKKRKETLEKFIIKFFNEWNDEKDTIYVDSREVQTEAGCRRSIGDIYLICSYYYPKCTLKEVWTILYGLFKSTKIAGFRSSMCSQIKKRVFYSDPGDDSAIYNKSEKDEYGMVFTDWEKEL